MKHQKWNGEWELTKGMKKPLQALMLGANAKNLVNVPHDAIF